MHVCNSCDQRMIIKCGWTMGTWEKGRGIIHHDKKSCWYGQEKNGTINSHESRKVDPDKETKLFNLE